MPKKSSSKTPEAMPEDPVVQQGKPSSTPKKLGHEIDEIFSGKKRKKPELEKAEKPTKDVAVKLNKAKKRNNKGKGSKDSGFVEPLSRPRKKTGDGLAIYTEEELGVSKADAGGTRLCPFDCSCCF
uniref:DUF1764 domain-containing protein n=1 Tax=Davidia involucrata TaxID=16924 RepID=A0A5B7BVB8_DAVIN